MKNYLSTEARDRYIKEGLIPISYKEGGELVVSIVIDSFIIVSAYRLSDGEAESNAQSGLEACLDIQIVNYYLSKLSGLDISSDSVTVGISNIYNKNYYERV